MAHVEWFKSLNDLHFPRNGVKPRCRYGIYRSPAMQNQNQQHNEQHIQSCLNHPDFHSFGLSWRGTPQGMVVDQLQFLAVNRASYEISAFLDKRIYAPNKQQLSVPFAALKQAWLEQRKAEAISASSANAAAAASRYGQVHYLFHTAFCCSTWLSRLLQAPGHSLALREPWLLRCLADVRRSGHVGQSIGYQDWGELLDCSLDLLAKRYHPQERVVIKPSNLCNVLIPELMNARADSKAVFLSNSLEDFLISVLKKNAETRAKMMALAQVLHNNPLVANESLHHVASQRGALAFSDLSDVQAAAVMWHVQQEQMQAAKARWPERFLLLQAKDLLAQPQAVCEQVNDFLGLGLPLAYFAGQRFKVNLQHHAKAPHLDYDPKARAEENQLIERRHHEVLQQTIHWYNEYFNDSSMSESAA